MLLLSTSSLKWYWLHRKFVFAKKAWYDGIDLVLEKWDFDSWNKEYVRSLSESFAMPVLSVTAPNRWITKKVVDEIIDLAVSIKAQNITFSPPHITDKNSGWFTTYIWKASRDNHIVITVQNVAPKFLLFVIPEYRSNNLLDIKKVTWFTSLNLSNIESSAWMDIMKAQNILGNTIKNIYLSDRRGPKMWLLPWNAWGWISTLPLESFFMKMRTSWYGWYFSLKVNPKELSVWDDKEVIKKLADVKDYYRKHFLNFKS
jgi:sugar phosphate isomerase/epimerase